METGPKRSSVKLPKIFWLFCVFLPSAVAMLCLRSEQNPGTGTLTGLILFNLVCSFAAASRLIEGIESHMAQIGLRLLLGVVLFFLNLFVVSMISPIPLGCSAT